MRTLWVLLLLYSTSFSRTINFAGITWYVKTGYGGPGPNYWSDSEQNVWVDSNGWLHLKIRYENGIWYCSEVYTEGFTQYGIHRFYIISRLDSLDKNIVFAPFLYSNDTTEVDIEFSKWGNENSWFNSQYVVQPWYHPGNVERFFMSLNGTYTTHYIGWEQNYIIFKSIHGHYPEPPNPGFLIHQWTYTGNDIPSKEENLRIHINLWLYQGNPPSNGEEVEVVIKNVEFPPLVNIQEELKNGFRVLCKNNVYRGENSLHISFYLDIPACITLKILNSNGGIVKTLVENGHFERGKHTMLWEDIKKCPPGIYFISAKINNYKKIKRIILY